MYYSHMEKVGHSGLFYLFMMGREMIWNAGFIAHAVHDHSFFLNLFFFIFLMTSMWIKDLIRSLL